MYANDMMLHMKYQPCVCGCVGQVTRVQGDGRIVTLPLTKRGHPSIVSGARSTQVSHKVSMNSRVGVTTGINGM